MCSLGVHALQSSFAILVNIVYTSFIMAFLTVEIFIAYLQQLAQIKLEYMLSEVSSYMSLFQFFKNCVDSLACMELWICS